MITGKDNKRQRELELNKLACGEVQVLVNVAILTEGWDCPPISCVVLLRQSSCKATMIQMIGRGLRAVDQKIHHGVVKEDCVVLDFEISTLLHGSLEQEVDLQIKEPKKIEDDDGTKLCENCKESIPWRAKICPLCGHKKSVDVVVLPKVTLTPIDMF